MIKIVFNDGKDFQENENIRDKLREFMKTNGFELDGSGYDTESNIYEDFFYIKSKRLKYLEDNK